MPAGDEELSARSRFFRGSADVVGRSRLGRRVLRTLSRNTTLQRLTIGGPNPIRLWEDDDHFRALAARAQRLTLLSDEGLFNVYQTASHTRVVAGDVAEVGVYQGGTACLLALIFNQDDREILLFDTFEGMPDSADSSRDRHRHGDFADTSVESVTRALAEWPRTRLVKGFFPRTATPYTDRTFSLVHIDVDIYQSVLDSCDFFYTRVAAGGALLFDDYGMRSCPGAKQAVDEFFGPLPEEPFFLPTGQCVVWKLP
jgi:O-methyltransferase